MVTNDGDALLDVICLLGSVLDILAFVIKGLPLSIHIIRKRTLSITINRNTYVDVAHHAKAPEIAVHGRGRTRGEGRRVCHERHQRSGTEVFEVDGGL